MAETFDKSQFYLAMAKAIEAAHAVDVPDTGIRDFSERPLTVFYVGGLGGNYQIAELLKAVKETEGEYICYNNRVISSYFFSTSGGSTENVKDVWVSSN